MRKIKIPYFLLLLIAFFATIFILKHQTEQSDFTETEAVEADNYLDKAADQFYQKNTSLGIEEIEKAILSMKKLERTLDDASEIDIDLAIARLKAFERHIKNDSINSEELDYAFAHAINALALSQLKLSQYDLHHNKKEEAKKALKTVMSHLYHSMKYSDSFHEKEEIGLIKQVKILIDSINHQKSYERQLNDIIEEIQSLIDS